MLTKVTDTGVPCLSNAILIPAEDIYEGSAPASKRSVPILFLFILYLQE
jgi:hypothetical protein